MSLDDRDLKKRFDDRKDKNKKIKAGTPGADEEPLPPPVDPIRAENKESRAKRPLPLRVGKEVQEVLRQVVPPKMPVQSPCSGCSASRPDSTAHGRARRAAVVAGVLVLTTAGACMLAYGTAKTGRVGSNNVTDYARHLFGQLRDPWVWFGLGAQGLFFMRFFYQWLVSEKRGRSTIPIAFWYFSLAGAVSTFVYAAGRLDPAIMLGQLPACFFYIRNLMLIHNRTNRLRQAGLPVAAGTDVNSDDLPD